MFRESNSQIRTRRSLVEHQQWKWIRGRKLVLVTNGSFSFYHTNVNSKQTDSGTVLAQIAQGSQHLVVSSEDEELKPIQDLVIGDQKTCALVIAAPGPRPRDGNYSSCPYLGGLAIQLLLCS